MKTLLIKRKQARGDVLLTTPVVRGLKKKWGPDSVIIFETKYPEIILNHPDVDHVITSNDITRTRPDVTVDLEVAYERLPGYNLIDAFAIAAGLRKGDYTRLLDFHPTEEGLAYGERIAHLMGSPFVVVAPGPGAWEGRNWKESNWKKVCEALLKNWKVILVGSNSILNYRNIPCHLNLQGATSIDMLGGLFKKASLFVGIDSFPLHMAGAMAVPRVGLFGITKGELIMCDSPHSVAVNSHPDHPFSGARHVFEKISSVRLGNPPQNPMDTIDTDLVLKSIDICIEDVKKPCPTLS